MKKSYPERYKATTEFSINLSPTDSPDKRMVSFPQGSYLGWDPETLEFGLLGDDNPIYESHKLLGAIDAGWLRPLRVLDAVSSLSPASTGFDMGRKKRVVISKVTSNATVKVEVK